MKFTFFVDNSREEEVIVYARERNELVNRIEDLVTEKSREITGFSDGTAEILDTDSVFCFIVENGRVVDGLGGGICQVSSTIYNAVLYANLEIVERHWRMEAGD